VKCILVTCVCVSLAVAAFPLCCMDSDVSWGNGTGSGCTLVVHYWADLQSVHGFCCYDNIARNVKCQPVLVLALCLFHVVISSSVELVSIGHRVMYTVSDKNTRIVFMAALRSRCGHYIFALWFLLSFFFSLHNLSHRRLDVYHTSTHGVALVQI